MPTLFSHFRKKWMAVMAIRNEVTPPIRKPFQSTITSDEATSSSFTADASTIIGIASKNENREAASRDATRNRPAVMLLPEREGPGTRAMAWAIPTMMASVELREYMVRWRLGSHSVMPSEMPNTREGTNIT